MLENPVRDVLPARLPAKPLKPVVDPAAWTGGDLAGRDDWKYVLTNEEIVELDDAVAAYRFAGCRSKTLWRKIFRYRPWMRNLRS